MNINSIGGIKDRLKTGVLSNNADFKTYQELFSMPLLLEMSLLLVHGADPNILDNENLYHKILLK